MKKNLSLVFAVLLTLSLILSACQPAPTPVQTEAAVPEQTAKLLRRLKQRLRRPKKSWQHRPK